jgi:hypothetical protein
MPRYFAAFEFGTVLLAICGTIAIIIYESVQGSAVVSPIIIAIILLVQVLTQVAIEYLGFARRKVEVVFWAV